MSIVCVTPRAITPSQGRKGNPPARAGIAIRRQTRASRTKRIW